MVDTPVTVEALASATDNTEDRVAAALAELAAELTGRGSGIDLREAGGGWRMYTRARYAPYVERLLLDGSRSKLTRAALEDAGRGGLPAARDPRPGQRGGAVSTSTRWCARWWPAV